MLPRMSGREEISGGHIFISYVREDAATVDRLAGDLGSAGADIWLDRNRLKPGERWRTAIREAIEDGMFFIACFSENSIKRDRSHMNEELNIALDELRKRPRDRAWFLPVLLNPDTLPAIEINARESLGDIHYVELYEDWDLGVKKLLGVIAPRIDAQPQPLANVGGARFKRPVSASYLSGSDFFTSILAGLDEIPRQPGSWEETQQILLAGHTLPPRYLYWNESSARSWLELCRDATFRTHHDAMRLWLGSTGGEVAMAVREELGREDFDYMSLGCGNGEKDAALLSRWLRDRADITYYPFDINLSLLTHAVRQVLDQVPHGTRERLHIKSSVGDLDHLSTLVGAFRQRPSPMVFAVLGNSLGALQSEHQLLSAIRNEMREEDLLLLEFDLNSRQQPVADLDSPRFSQFYFNPLRDHGIAFDPGQFCARSADGLSAIPGATTQVIEYRNAEIDGRRVDSVVLGELRTYALDGFLGALRDLGLDVASSWIPDGGRDLPCVSLIRRSS